MVGFKARLDHPKYMFFNATPGMDWVSGLLAIFGYP